MNADDVLEEADVPPAEVAERPLTLGQYASMPLHEAVRIFRRQLVRYVLAEQGGHRGEAARALGITRSHLWRLLK